MGEVVLRKIQVATEVTRGTAIAATKKLYGTFLPTRAQARRFAVEDRGSFTDKFRANPKLIEASFTLTADATFEDLPLFASTFLNGTIAQTGSVTTGYSWAAAPDTTSDTLKTLTIEAGDDTVAWQGAFGTVDTADFTMALDDALVVALAGFVKDWIPQTSGSLATSFTGFTGSLAERVVESVMGYQAKLYMDVAGGTMGATQVTGRFIAATWGIHNQNKRKYFGDGSATFTKLGRGRRQISATITFEAVDPAQYALFFSNSESLVRIAFTGTGTAGTTGPVLKAMQHDFWGYWETFVVGARDTNTTFQMQLQAVYDATAAKEYNLTVLNAQSTI